MPAGSYSDDTQLRLATCRAIRGDGFFDVESFAKIELPVWLNYALGAGRASKAAAANLSQREPSWSSNYFQAGELKYWAGGGNGAAMRIQPHVWAAQSRQLDAFIPDVIRNAVCTHGHPRGILGAAIHATLLNDALVNREIARPEQWAELGVLAAEEGLKAVAADQELQLIWYPNWSRVSKAAFDDVWRETAKEWVQAATHAARIAYGSDSPEAQYRNALAELGGFDPKERGSGIKTVLFATLLAWLYRYSRPHKALLTAANTFRSDTDSIASMTGALLGAATGEHDSPELQDREYIEQEARRLYLVSQTEKQRSFEYPDLVRWIPPRSQSDAWLISGDQHILAGLGPMTPVGDEYRPTKGTELVWQWCRLDFGQHVLAKRRANGTVNASAGPVAPPPGPTPASAPATVNVPQPTNHTQRSDADGALTLDQWTQACIRSGFDPHTLGEALLAVSRGANGIERAIAFAAIIAKARLAREGK
jgi:ADP-ribosylglycohydrolase